MKIFKLILLVLFAFKAYGHGDHSVPGAIPPAPNGGTLGESKHLHEGSHKHAHNEATEREIFLEANYKNKQLVIHFLELDPKSSSFFIVRDFKDFTKLKISIEDARKKIKINKKHLLKDKKLIVDMSNERARRLSLNITGLYHGAKYQTTLQVERK